ncbi:MAG: DUF3618 domain-containing protein [Ornithinimicrobium sp.]|jgi:di/tripeptidase|uniref:DUF3618 domain-containing protein n=1 Tax=Ornithinimicrobium sp. TaxID=1977084 RepID=UPI0017F55DDA|nr:DUF3618 domain-containing protein [Actinomycetota bacterium]
MADTKATRSTEEIEADLSASRDRLARTVDELAFRASPEEIKRRGTEKLDAQKAQLKAKVDGTVRNEDGSIRLELVAQALGAVAAVALVLGLARRAFYRG